MKLVCAEVERPSDYSAVRGSQGANGAMDFWGTAAEVTAYGNLPQAATHGAVVP